jgi:hypothetical protein
MVRTETDKFSYEHAEGEKLVISMLRVGGYIKNNTWEVVRY